MDVEKLEKAQGVFNRLCAVLDSKNCTYRKNEEKLEINIGVQGDDLPMEVDLSVGVENQRIMILSHMPFIVPEDKRLDMAIAVSVVNNVLVEGSFDLDITDGHMFFRVTNSFIDSEISGELLFFLLSLSFSVIDDYNDKFFAIAKNLLSVDDFIKSV